MYDAGLCRYLGELKLNMRNKARPKGCITESILPKEAMALCSGFIDGFESLLNNLLRNDDNDETLGSCSAQASTLFPHAGTALGKPRSYVIEDWKKNKHIDICYSIVLMSTRTLGNISNS
jgi:hypothetical protein